MVNQNKFFYFIVSLLIVFFVLNIFSSALNISQITKLNLSSLREAVSSISSAKDNTQSLNLEEASKNFTQASQYFQDLKDSSIYFENDLLSPQEISQAGLILSRLGENLTNSVANLKALPTEMFEINKQVFLGETQSKRSQSLTTQISQTKSTIELSISQATQASQLLSDQSYQLLPPKLKNEYKDALQKLDQVQTILQRVDALLAGTLDLLGHRTPHRYLVLLQNQNELRPLGGFLGSVMSFQVDQGIITDINFQDIYDIDGQAQKTLDVPPEFQGFSTEIFSRDANYSPIPEVSIQKIQNLFSHSKQTNYRSYIILNHNFLAKLLEKAGPLSLQIDGKTYQITSTNFSLILNTIVEIEQNKDVVNKILEDTQTHIFQNISQEDLFQVIYTSIQDRDLQFFTLNQTIQSEIDKAPLYKPISINTPPETDYLLVTETNIGGNKSDQYMQTNITHSTKFSSNQILNTINLSKTHTYSNQTEIINNSILQSNNIPSIPDELRFILGRGDNKTMTKLYIPEGSTLVSYEGDFTKDPEVYRDTDFQKTYILFETQTAPGQTSNVQITYRPKLKIPNQKVQTYQLLLQKPSGFSFQFQKELVTDQTIRLNTPNFQTTQNQPFKISSTTQRINQDTTFQNYFY